MTIRLLHSSFENVDRFDGKLRYGDQPLCICIHNDNVCRLIILHLF